MPEDLARALDAETASWHRLAPAQAAADAAKASLSAAMKKSPWRFKLRRLLGADESDPAVREAQKCYDQALGSVREISEDVARRTDAVSVLLHRFLCQVAPLYWEPLLQQHQAEEMRRTSDEFARAVKRLCEALRNALGSMRKLPSGTTSLPSATREHLAAAATIAKEVDATLHALPGVHDGGNAREFIVSRVPGRIMSLEQAPPGLVVEIVQDLIADVEECSSEIVRDATAKIVPADQTAVQIALAYRDDYVKALRQQTARNLGLRD